MDLTRIGVALTKWVIPAARQLPSLGRSWPTLVCALIFSVVCAIAGQKIGAKAEFYPDFILGQIAWDASSKTQDYCFLAFFVLGSLASMMGIAFLRAALLSRLGRAVVERFETMLAIACFPALIWFGSLLLTRTLSLSLLYFSAATCAITIALFTLFVRRAEVFRRCKPELAMDIVGGTLAIYLGAFFAVLGLGLLATRLALIFDWSGPFDTVRMMRHGYWVSLGGVVLFSAAAFWRAPDAETLRSWLRKLLLAVQVPMAGLFLILVPALRGAATGAPQIAPSLTLIVTIMAAVSLADLLRRGKSGHPATVLSALSPLLLIAVILALKTPSFQPPAVTPDDYHYGEFLIPWWSLTKFHLIPYWDFSPARGLLSNYLPGMLTQIFFGETAANFGFGQPIFYLVVLLVTFFPLAWVVGREAAFLLLLLGPAVNGISEIDVVNTAMLALLCRGFTTWRPTHWLSAYAILSLVAVLLAPGQGALMVLALSPLAFALLWRGWRDDRRHLLFSIGALAAAVLILGLATPFGRMLVGAIRYGIEQSSINSVANGIPWSRSISGQTIGNHWLWEAGRASWIVVAGIAGLFAIGALAVRDATRRNATIAFSLPIFLLALLFIVRAAGRIDADGMSRLGIATIWFWALLVPMLLFAALKGRRLLGALAVCTVFAASIQPSDLRDIALLPYQPTQIITLPADMVDGAAVGLPNLGKGLVEPNHLKRLIGLRRTIDKYLAADETYLDLTNHNADYFYFDRPPPIEVSAVYNLVHPNQQIRAVHAIQEQRIPLALIDAQNIVHDELPVSLRAPLLYRYLVLNTVPFRDGDATWLVRPDRLSAMGLPPQAAGHPDETGMVLLDKAFRTADLRDIPFAWGQSAKSLSSKMAPVKQLSTVSVRDLRPLDGTHFAVIGPTPTAVYSVGAGPLNGRDAGLLAFDFKCTVGRASIPLAVTWSTKSRPADDAALIRFNGVHGRLIVPLDAAPRWLLAEDIAEIRIQVMDPSTCAEFELGNIALFQRSAAVLVE